jgi:hypothetical protein
MLPARGRTAHSINDFRIAPIVRIGVLRAYSPRVEAA